MRECIKKLNLMRYLNEKNKIYFKYKKDPKNVYNINSYLNYRNRLKKIFKERNIITAENK